MSAEENKAIARRWFEEFWNKRTLSLDEIDAFFTADFVYHSPPSGIPLDLEGFKQQVTMLLAAIPDVHITIEDMIAEGDKLVARWTFTATHKGELMGIAPTGKQITVSVMAISRIAGGKFAEVWELADQLGMMQQLGVVPPPGQGGA